MIMEHIVEYNIDDVIVVLKSENHIVTRSEQRRFSKSTSGWKMLVLWKDGSKMWVTLKDLKELHPV